MTITKAPDKINKSVQEIANLGFDTEYNLPVMEMVGFAGNSMVRAEADDLQIKIVESGGYTYVCKAAVGSAVASALWKIFRIDTTGNKMYADGNASFDNVATDPTSLTYSYT